MSIEPWEEGLVYLQLLYQTLSKSEYGVHFNLVNQSNHFLEFSCLEA